MKVLLFLRLPRLQLIQGPLGWEAAGWSWLLPIELEKSPGRLLQYPGRVLKSPGWV